MTCWARCLRGPGRPSRDVSIINACPAAMLLARLSVARRVGTSCTAQQHNTGCRGGSAPGMSSGTVSVGATTHRKPCLRCSSLFASVCVPPLRDWTGDHAPTFAALSRHIIIPSIRTERCGRPLVTLSCVMSRPSTSFLWFPRCRVWLQRAPLQRAPRCPLLSSDRVVPIPYVPTVGGSRQLL